MKIKFPFFFIVFASFYCHGNQEIEDFYSTSFLRNYKAVRTSLRHAGFQKITFKTSDNFKLSGLFLARPDATCTVIICAGWRPGRKEGLATFYDLLPTYCNILLFDARGRGESEGSFLGKIWQYGINEYRDIAAAISWTNKNNTLPIILIGFCSGAFNAVHALIHLQNRYITSHVKGLVFDSGWGSVSDVTASATFANIQECLIAVFKYIYGNKEIVKKSFIFKLSNKCAHYLCNLSHFLFIQPWIKQYKSRTSLFNKINYLNTAVFFIHSYDDQHADIYNVIKLSKLTPFKKCWLLKKSYHTCHHLIHKELYKEKLIAFIDSVINEGDVNTSAKIL